MILTRGITYQNYFLVLAWRTWNLPEGKGEDYVKKEEGIWAK